MSSDHPKAFHILSKSLAPDDANNVRCAVFLRWRTRGLRGLFVAVVLLAAAIVGTPAHAQNALCPTSAGGTPGIMFQGSTCTNSSGSTGAYSNAALASESLSQFTQGSSQDTTKATMSAVSDRRAAETERCPDGFTRVNGICVPATSAARFVPEATDPTLASMPAVLMAFAPASPLLTKAPVAEPAHWAFWTQGYGEYTQLSGQSPGLGEFSTLSLNVKSTSWAGGVLSGADVTYRNLAHAGDGLILGLLGGYEAASVSLSATSTSSIASTPNGFSTMTAHLSGPVTGAYASYFNGGFSTDLAFKVEFYDMGLSFTDLLGFAGTGGGFTGTVPFSGSGSTWLNVYTTSGNVNYRIPIDRSFWVEPTGGFVYSVSNFASGADQFGLADGSVLRLQGGNRFGFDSIWNGTRVTTVLTGLMYDDVLVTGGVLPNAANPVIFGDQGKLRGEGILAFNFYKTNGVSYLLQGDIQGGQGLFAAGGKGGFRVAW
jgi:hypothetical protein